MRLPGRATSPQHESHARYPLHIQEILMSPMLPFVGVGAMLGGVYREYAQ